MQTGRGGGRDGTKSKLKPIARWLQRRLLWLCGLTEVELAAFVEEQKLGRASEEQEAEAVEDGGEATDENDDSVDEFVVALMTGFI